MEKSKCEWEGAGTCLTSGAAIYDGFHENAQVRVVLLGPVPLDADPKASGARVVQRDLEGHELSRTIRTQHHFVFLRLLWVQRKLRIVSD